MKIIELSLLNFLINCPEALVALGDWKTSKIQDYSRSVYVIKGLINLDFITVTGGVTMSLDFQASICSFINILLLDHYIL